LELAKLHKLAIVAIQFQESLDHMVHVDSFILIRGSALIWCDIIVTGIAVSHFGGLVVRFVHSLCTEFLHALCMPCNGFISRNSGLTLLEWGNPPVLFAETEEASIVVLEEAWYLPAVGCVGVVERHTTNTAFLMSRMSPDNTASSIVARIISCSRHVLQH
jgi:hypothetical protein